MVGSVNYVSRCGADITDINMRLLLNVYKIAQRLGEAVVINPVANCAYPGAMDLYVEGQLWDGPIHPSVLSYGSTRRMMLVLADCYARQYGVQTINLLVPNMYGPHDSLDPNKTHAFNALVIKFIRALKEASSQVEIWGTGTPVREWLYVKDFSHMVARIICAREAEAEPINVAQSRGYSIRELVDQIRSLLGYRGQVVYNDRFPDGAAQKVMDATRFRERFPDFTFTSLSDGLLETVHHYQERM